MWGFILKDIFLSFLFEFVFDSDATFYRYWHYCFSWRLLLLLCYCWCFVKTVAITCLFFIWFSIFFCFCISRFSILPQFYRASLFFCYPLQNVHIEYTIHVWVLCGVLFFKCAVYFSSCFSFIFFASSIWFLYCVWHFDFYLNKHSVSFCFSVPFWSTSET